MGMLDALIDWQGRNRERRDSATVAAGQRRAQTAYGQAAAALNLNAPDIGAIAMLAKADPAAASALLGQAAQSQTPAARQDLEFGKGQIEGQRLGQQSSRLQNLLAASQERRQQQAFPGQMEGQRLSNQGQALQMQGERQRQALAAVPPPPPSAGQQLSQAWEAQTGAPVPAGYRVQPRFTPDGQPFLDMQPVEGTKEYNLALDGMRGGETAVIAIDDMLDQLATEGTEYAGAGARKMRQQRDRILANYAALQNLGVLQPGEVERLDAVLPDPTSFGVQLNPAAAGQIAAVYEQLRQQTIAKLQDAREKFWYVPQAPILPEEQALGR